MIVRSMLLAALAACGPLCAQSQNIVFVDDNNAASGRVNAFPFGATGSRTQQLVPQSVLGAGSKLIQDLFIAPSLDSAGIYNESEIAYGDFEIRMGITTLAALTTTWAVNSSGSTTVYRGPLRVRFRRDQWVPIGLPASYRWQPTSANENLVIDFICWSTLDTGAIPPNSSGYFMNVRTSLGGTISRAYRGNWLTNQGPTAQNVDGAGVKLGVLLDDGNFVVHGGGCIGSSGLAPEIGSAPGTWPSIGRLLDVRLTQGPSNRWALLSLGVENRTFGGLPLPLSLASAGAAGCRMWHDSLAVSAPVPTSASGGASFTLPIPNTTTLMAGRVYATWFSLDPTVNTLGLTTSGYATIILGT